MTEQNHHNHNGPQERRQSVIDLQNKMEKLSVQYEDIKKITQKLYNCLEQEFGGTSLNGNPTEGNVNMKLRELGEDVAALNKKVQTQNGRVGKLELWQARVFGAVGVIGILFSFITLIINLLKH